MNKSILAITALNVAILGANMVSPVLADLIVSRFELAPRTAVTSFPVPSFRPTTAGQVIAKFTSTGLTVFGTVTANGFVTQ